MTVRWNVKPDNEGEGLRVVDAVVRKKRALIAPFFDINVKQNLAHFFDAFEIFLCIWR